MPKRRKEEDEATPMSAVLPTVEKIVYLDVEFISLKYEEATGTAPTSVLTKTEGGKADIGIPLLRAGVHTQESRSYSLSSFKMLSEIYKRLMDYDHLDLEKCESGKGSFTGWVEGNFSLGSWGNEDNDREFHEVFALYQEHLRPYVSLLTNNEYFYPGIGAILGTSSALKLNVNMPVKALVKILYYAEGAGSWVAVPLLIVEVQS